MKYALWPVARPRFDLEEIGDGGNPRPAPDASGGEASPFRLMREGVRWHGARELGLEQGSAEGESYGVIRRRR